MPAQGNIGLADSIRSGFTRQNLIAEAQRRGLTLPQTNQPTLQPSEAIEPQQPVRAPAIGRSQQDLIAEAQRRGLTLPEGTAPATPAPAPDVSAPGGLGTFLQTTIANVPGSAADVATGVMSLFTPEGLRQLGDVAGRTTFGGLDVLLGKESEDAKAAKAVFKESTRLFRDPLGTIQSDPVGALLDVAGILSGGAGILAGRGGTLGRIGAKAAQIEAKINPITVAGTKGAKLAKKGAEKLLETAKARAAVRSGVGEAAIDIAMEAGKEGGKRKEAVHAAMTGGVVLEDVAGKIATAIDDADDLKSLRFREDLKDLSLKNADNEIDIMGVRKAVAKELENTWNVKIGQTLDVSDAGAIPDGVHVIKFGPEGPGLTIDYRKSKLRKSPAEQKRVTDMLDEFAKWDNNGIQESYDVMQVLDTIIQKGIDSENFGRSNAMLTAAKSRIRNELGSKVDGFNKMQSDFAGAQQFLEKTRKLLGIKKGHVLDEVGIVGNLPGGFDETLLTKLGNLLNDRGARNLGLRRAYVTELERVMEIGELKKLDIAGLERMSDTQIKKLARENNVSANVMESLAGFKFAGHAQTGIARAGTDILGPMVGGSIGGTLLGPAIGAPIGIMMGRWIGNMTINNPRAVGRLFMGLGARTTDIAPFVKRLQNVVDKLPAEKLKRGLTIGTAVQMARERAPQDPDVRDLFEKLQLR